MIPYIIIFLFLLFFSVSIDLRNNRNKYNTYVKVAIVLLILLAGLRNGVGSDTHNYAAMFYKAPTLGELLGGNSDLEWLKQPLWYISNTIVKSISNHFLLFQLLHAVVFNLLLLRFLRRTTNYVFTALLLIYCIVWWTMSFEVLRESICVVLFLNAILELQKGSVKNYLLWCFPGVFIHWFFPPIVLIVLLLNYMKPVISVGVFTCAAVFLFVIDTSFISQNIMGVYLSFIGDEDSTEALHSYLQNESAHGFSSLNIFGLVMSFILVSPYVISGIGMYKRTNNKVGLSLIIMYVFFFIAQGRLVILSRYLNYLTPYAIVVLANYFYQIKKDTIVRAFLVVMMMVFCYEGYSNFKAPSKILGNSKYNYYHIPYTSIFDTPDSRRAPIDY